jgi:hypothetical protein
VFRREGGVLSGLIVHLGTGLKRSFTDLATVTRLLAGMMNRADGPAREPES